MESGQFAALRADAPGRDATDAEILDALFDRYEQRIYNLIYRLVGDHDEAADLTSDTFLHALRSFHRFRGEAQPYTWLYRIAVNLCKNHFRRTRHRSQFHSFSLDEPVGADGSTQAREIEDVRQEPSALFETLELQRQLHAAIGSLREDFRTVLVLKELEGLSYAEIAEVIGCTVKAVKSRLFRARAALRRKLAHYLCDAD